MSKSSSRRHKLKQLSRKNGVAQKKNTTKAHAKGGQEDAMEKERIEKEKERKCCTKLQSCEREKGMYRKQLLSKNIDPVEYFGSYDEVTKLIKTTEAKINGETDEEQHVVTAEEKDALHVKLIKMISYRETLDEAIAIEQKRKYEFVTDSDSQSALERMRAIVPSNFNDITANQYEVVVNSRVAEENDRARLAKMQNAWERRYHGEAISVDDDALAHEYEQRFGGDNATAIKRRRTLHALYDRFRGEKLVTLVRMDPTALSAFASTHIADLKSHYAPLTLDLIELRAVWYILRDIDMEKDVAKKEWKDDVFKKLESKTKEANVRRASGKPEARDPRYTTPTLIKGDKVLVRYATQCDDNAQTPCSTEYRHGTVIGLGTVIGPTVAAATAAATPSASPLALSKAAPKPSMADMMRELSSKVSPRSSGGRPPPHPIGGLSAQLMSGKKLLNKVNLSRPRSPLRTARTNNPREKEQPTWTIQLDNGETVKRVRTDIELAPFYPTTGAEAATSAVAAQMHAAEDDEEATPVKISEADVNNMDALLF